jgi:hypothetical protein
MKDSTSLAIRSDVPFGNAEIEGYFLPEKLWTKTNKFGVSKTQAVILVYPELDRKYGASKYTEIVKSKKAQFVAPQGFTLYQKVLVEGARERIDLMPVSELPLFLQVCRLLRKGSTPNKATEKQYQVSLVSKSVTVSPM